MKKYLIICWIFNTQGRQHFEATYLTLPTRKFISSSFFLLINKALEE
tara:strand:+ start:353 stop:493 length:141 start_codon:yes stop_codon:yes gene_type:complete